MLLAFDLDETLVSTREANIWAYAQIGIVPPENFHLVSWQEWCSERDHTRKQDYLRKGLLMMLGKHRGLLPAAELLVSASSPVLKIIVTRASRRSVRAIDSVYPMLRYHANEYHCALSDGQRLGTLEYLSRGGDTPGIYFDDDESMCLKVAELPGWRAICVKNWSPSA